MSGWMGRALRGSR